MLALHSPKNDAVASYDPTAPSRKFVAKNCGNLTWLENGKTRLARVATYRVGSSLEIRYALFN
jgi:hypothetical protein